MKRRKRGKGREQTARTSQDQKRRGESKRKRGVVERGAGSPGTFLARKTRSQMERRERSQVKGDNAMRGTIVE